MVWQSAVDPNSGNTYYYNVETSQTTWEKHEALKARRSAVMYGDWIGAEVACEGFEHSNDPTLVVYAMQHDGYTKMVGMQHGHAIEPPRAKSGNRQLTPASASAAWNSADTQSTA